MERRLPLFVSILLILVIGTLSLLSYHALRTQLITGADEHSAQVGVHLSDLLTRSSLMVRDRADSLAAHPVLRAAPGGDEDARARAVDVLSEFVSRHASVIGIGITSGGAEWLVWAPGPAVDSVPAEVLALNHPQRPATPAIGPIRSAGGPALFYDVSAPLSVPDEGESAAARGSPEEAEAGAGSRSTEGAGTAGGGEAGSDGHWIVTRYRVAAGDQARALASLVGPDAVFLVGSIGSSVEWTDLQHSVHAPEPNPDGGFRWNEVDYRGAILELEQAPWRVWTGVPQELVLAPLMAFAGAEAALGLLTLLLGAGAALLLGRHVSRPIVRLTRAVDSISRGGYHERVPMEGPDEVVRLGGAFNRMAERVEEATENLEEQVEVRTQQLSGALEELRAAQEQLLRRERLAFLGQLAGGVGHELRNPLGVMTNAVYYLEAVSPDAPNEVTEYYGILRTQLQLADKIVTDLLDFARSPAPNHAPVALDRLIDEQLERIGENGVEVVREYDDALPPALADQTQIGQVVFNLLTNAVQAMDGSPGRLTLKTQAMDEGEVAISVSDTGPGISEESQPKIFEPLFTTRARGIGLGLSVSKSLVEANRGQIGVRSCPGAGTTFVVRLPAAPTGGA